MQKMISTFLNSYRYMLVDNEEDKKVHRPVTPKDVSLLFNFLKQLLLSFNKQYMI